jgi:hypothetical protein
MVSLHDKIVENGSFMFYFSVFSHGIVFNFRFRSFVKTASDENGKDLIDVFTDAMPLHD